MEILKWINLAIAVIFTLCYSYQFVYLAVPWLKRKKEQVNDAPKHRFAIMICARNEASVIGDLLDSIHAQTYDQNLLTTFVMADNCTDHTANIAASKGAVVYRRMNRELIGKGYALEELRKRINVDYPQGFDGYFVFDADNILDCHYIEEMNKTFSQGHDIITSYRNSKNYGDNWISAGYALWFLRESRYLNHARYLLGTSCAVSGTGFMFSRKVAEEIKTWPFHLLTEDIEFSVNQITNGRKIAFCPTAELYDEQPTQFSQSWKQRLRWAKGYMQVFGKYYRNLISGIFHGNFSCFDMSMNIMPAFILSAISVVSNVTLCFLSLYRGESISYALVAMGQMVLNMYLTLFAIGLLTTVSEWKHIQATTARKILYVVTFPVFMFTYIPVSVAALFWKGNWSPIVHSVSAKRCGLTGGMATK